MVRTFLGKTIKFNEVNAFKRRRLFGTEEVGRWPQHQKDHHGFEAVEYMLNTNSERKKKSGRKRSIGKRTERRMKRTVARLLTSGEKVTARKVKEKCELM